MQHTMWKIEPLTTVREILEDYFNKEYLEEKNYEKTRFNNDK